MEGKGVLGRVGAHIRTNVVAYVALFMAFSGVAYGGIKPLLDEKGSVDSANIENGSVSRKDLGGGSVAEGELSAKLKRRLGLAAGAPADGTYLGTGTDEVSGKSVTFYATWQNGQPESAYMTSSVAGCTSPHADGFEQLGPGIWTVTGDTASQRLVATLQSLGSGQLMLTNALVTNYDLAPCKVEMVPLALETELRR